MAVELPGYFEGRHYVDWTDDARHLEWMGDIAAAEVLLAKIVFATEAENAANGLGVAPFAYERLAILARKRRDDAAELAILERFAEQDHAPGAMPPRLLRRLEKARAPRPTETAPASAPTLTTPAPADAAHPFWQRAIPPKVLFIDVETTGLEADDRIVSIGAILLNSAALADNRVDCRFVHYICDPGRNSHPKAAAVHGYSDRLLRYQVPFAAVAKPIRELITESDLIAAHNAEFDLSFIDAELAAVNLPPISCRSFCTMKRYQSFYSGSASLDAVAARIGLARAGRRHGALEDAWLAMVVYLWLHGCPARLPFEAFAAPWPSNLRRLPLLPFGLLFPRKPVPRLKAPRRVAGAPLRAQGFGPRWRPVGAAAPDDLSDTSGSGPC